MKKVIIILLLGGIAFYTYSLNKQISDVETICSRYPLGASADGILNIQNEYSTQYTGAYAINNNPDARSATFCAALTMCDVSCSLGYENNIIIKSKLIRL